MVLLLKQSLFSFSESITHFVISLGYFHLLVNGVVSVKISVDVAVAVMVSVEGRRAIVLRSQNSPCVWASSQVAHGLLRLLGVIVSRGHAITLAFLPELAII